MNGKIDDFSHPRELDAAHGPRSAPVPVRGVLRVSRYGPGQEVERPLRHRSVYVNGADYSGMTDNDIRGFLDGGFIWGWNQATQIHVRLGRSREHSNPRYGESELFRVLQRWEGIELPSGARLLDACLALTVEEGTPMPLRFLLYRAKQDWTPGEGGIHGNNVSPPAPGEVWWIDRAFEEGPWGLPGAGYAAEDDPGADTGAMPLADAEYEPGQTTLIFRSHALTEYIEERASSAAPLLFLLKLADGQEDTPGCFINLCSGEHGDSRNPVRRPRLELEWQSSSELEAIEHSVYLERGRVLELPRLEALPGVWSASFASEEGYASPSVQVRSGTGEAARPWRRATHPFHPEGEWMQFRVLAMPDPVALGSAFDAGLADTWVLTGPPERQVVTWHFESPTGAVHVVEAAYEGGYRWSVRFQPDEVGAWRYRWSQSFLPEPYVSAPGEFHVHAESIESVVEHLAHLTEACRNASRDRRMAIRLRMYALERAGMQLLTPSSFGGPPGRMLRESLRDVRKALWGKPIPEPIPLESHRLVEEWDGVPLVDPFPVVRRRPSRGSSRPRASRLVRYLRRLRRRAGGRDGGGTSDEA